MKATFYPIAGVLMLALFSLFAKAQCADSFSSQTFHCVDGEGCSDEVTVHYPNADQYGVYVECEGIDCCGQLFTTCYGVGNCEPAALKNPGFKKELTQLALTSEVLVASCEGHYLLFEPAHPRIASVATFSAHRRSFIDERLWR